MAAIALGFTCTAGNAAPPPPAKGCPPFGWAEGLGKFQDSTAAFPTNDTAKLPTPDSNFHEWSWEAFVWATALITDPASGATVPRFMTLPTPADLTNNSAEAGQIKVRPLTLAARSQTFHAAPGFTEEAGAIVEADGNMLVAQNGYPVYGVGAADSDLFRDGAEESDRDQRLPDPAVRTPTSTSATPSSRPPGSARCGQQPPAGAYTTQAQVPVLGHDG